jgi:4-amino-4-deoxy-L-arabinose transferase-like glycosyltransferase
VLAAAARLLVLVIWPHYTPTNDALDYDHHAVAIATTGHYPQSGLGGPTAFRPPAFPVLLAGVYKLVGVGSATTRWEAGRILQVLLGAIAVGLICLIARRLWGAKVALLAGAIAAVYPPLLLVGSSLMTEPLYLVFSLSAVLAALRARDAGQPGRWALLSGVLCGLTALTRGNGIFLLVPVALLAWSGRPRRSLRAVSVPLVAIAATLLTIAPWAVRNSVAFHQFVPLGTEGGYALAGTYNDAARSDARAPWLWQPPLARTLTLHRREPRLNEADISSRLSTEVVDFVRAHPGSPFAVAYWNARRLLNLPGPGIERELASVWDYPRALAVISVYAFWLIGLLAIAGALTRATRRAPAAFWLCPLALAVPTLFFLGLTRYRVPADPYVVILAALGIVGARRPAQRAA